MAQKLSEEKLREMIDSGRDTFEAEGKLLDQDLSSYQKNVQDLLVAVAARAYLYGSMETAAKVLGEDFEQTSESTKEISALVTKGTNLLYG